MQAGSKRRNDLKIAKIDSAAQSLVGIESVIHHGTAISGFVLSYQGTFAALDVIREQRPEEFQLVAE